MKRKWKKLLAGLCVATMGMSMFAPLGIPARAVQAEDRVSGREVLNFNSDWGFYRGDLENAAVFRYASRLCAGDAASKRRKRFQQRRAGTLRREYDGAPLRRKKQPHLCKRAAGYFFPPKTQPKAAEDCDPFL